ncbi:MAG: PAS domain S-box protein, partial [Dehalococcoidales bacterium]|nr:PAS domain S-box protein [Dehalococcoidales bacterium]
MKKGQKKSNTGQPGRSQDLLFIPNTHFLFDMLDNSPLPLVISDPNGTLVYVNKSMERLTGYSSGELIGSKPPFPWWPEEYAKTYDSEYQQDKNHDLGHYERVARKKSGETFWTSITLHNIKEKGTPRYVISVFSDITDRKKTEQASKESEGFKNTLLTHAPNPIVVYGADDTVLYVNPAFERLTGFAGTDVTGLLFPYPWWPEQFITQYSSVQIGEDKKPLENIERRYRKKNGDLFWVSISYRPFTENNQIKFKITSWLDITERKKAEEALKENETFTANMLEHAPNPIMVVNPDSSIRYVNTALENITGYSRKEVLG